ncbi:SagB family peptide dehydrogenase, partial [Actinophytocola sp.]|uniref:SagB family peptide dehydrogenase n=1 Tax=Actinophytocola sp. TaxID=1872138 RepID=UPI002ED60893
MAFPRPAVSTALTGPHEQTIPLWSFREDVAVESTDDGLNILSRWGEVLLDHPRPATAESLRRMTLGPVALANVTGLDWFDLVGVFDQVPGCVVRSLGLRSSAAPLLSATPVSPRARFELPTLDREAALRLCRYAFLRESNGDMVLESPLSNHRVVLHRPLVSWVVGELSRPATSLGIAHGVDVPEPLVAEILPYLLATGMVVYDDAEPLAWTPHELMFHSRSRLGRHDESALGDTERVAPLPAVKPLPAGPRFPLYRPDPAVPAAHDMPLTAAVELRRSVREFADEGPSAAQLGELLYRSARVRSLVAGMEPRPVSERPYPSAGGLYELELYLTVDRCDGLPRGIYHYDPNDHALTLVNDRREHADELLDSAKLLLGTNRRPPTLITMTARMGRMSCGYDGIAYTTTLKHVGVLQQTL